MGWWFQGEDFPKKLRPEFNCPQPCFCITELLKLYTSTPLMRFGRKFRFSRLGISSELLKETSVERKRNNELKTSRGLKKKKHKELNL